MKKKTIRKKRNPDLEPYLQIETLIRASSVLSSRLHNMGSELNTMEKFTLYRDAWIAGFQDGFRFAIEKGLGGEK